CRCLLCQKSAQRATARNPYHARPFVPLLKIAKDPTALPPGYLLDALHRLPIDKSCFEGWRRDAGMQNKLRRRVERILLQMTMDTKGRFNKAAKTQWCI